MSLKPEKNTPKSEQRLAMGVVIFLALLGGVGIVGVMLTLFERTESFSWPDAEALFSDIMTSKPPAQTMPASDGRTSNATAILTDAIKRNALGDVNAVLAQISIEDLNNTVAGMTPLMTAASMGEVEIISALLNKGADPNRRGSSERTALQYAAEKNRLEAAVKLLDAGADIDGYDNTRLTPLTMAADRNFTALAALLIAHGADVNIAHVNGWTPLIDAARNGNLELVRLLIRAGADTSAQLPDGNTASTMAAQYKHKAVVDVLR